MERSRVALPAAVLRGPGPAPDERKRIAPRATQASAPGPAATYNPRVHPILFEIPGLGLPLRSFGVMVAAGFIVGTLIYGRLVERYSSGEPNAAERYGAVPLWILVGVILGARMLYVAVEIAKSSDVGADYLAEPWLMLAIWHGGLVMYGGLFGAMACGLWAARRQRLPLSHALDMGLTAGFFGLAIGRVGCLLVGDDFGAIGPARFRGLPLPVTRRAPAVLPAHAGS